MGETWEKLGNEIYCELMGIDKKMNTDWTEDLLFEVAFWFGVSVIVISMVLVVLTF